MYSAENLERQPEIYKDPIYVHAVQMSALLAYADLHDTTLFKTTCKDTYASPNSAATLLCPHYFYAAAAQQ